MSTIRDLLSRNSSLIPGVLERKLDAIINISESNTNERQIERPLRVLIRALAIGVQSPHEAIHDYLNAPETQNSSTREVFEDMDWSPVRQENDEANEHEVNENDVNENDDLEEGEIRELTNDRRTAFQGVRDFLNMFPQQQ